MKPLWQMLFRCTAKGADGFQEHFSPSCPLSAMSQPCLSWKRAGILEYVGTFPLSWVTALSFVCKGTAGIDSFQPVAVTLFEILHRLLVLPIAHPQSFIHFQNAH